MGGDFGPAAHFLLGLCRVLQKGALGKKKYFLKTYFAECKLSTEPGPKVNVGRGAWWRVRMG